MSSLTFLVVVVAVFCVFYPPAKVLAALTLVLLAVNHPIAAVFALLLLASLYFITRKPQ